MRHNNCMKKILNKKNLILFVPLIILMVISFLTMYNSRYISKIYVNHLNKQMIWYFISIIIILFLPNIKLLFKFSNIIYLFNVLLLLLVLKFGNTVNGARAWFNLGFIAFQPSEFMKLSYTLYLTTIIKKYKRKNIKTDSIFLLKVLIIFLIPSILIFLEPDTGAIIFLGIITLFMLFSSDISKWWFLLIFIIVALFISSFFYLFYFKQDTLINLIGTTFFYRMDRIFNLKNNMQLNNALIAIGNGNIWGYGINKASIYIPEAATDFAFSVAVSSMGFICSLVIIICYFIIDTYFINSIFKTKNKTTKLFTSGFISVFIFSQLYNIFMNIGYLPIMGICLPFLSYGGSSLVVFSLYIAIILRLKTNNI